MSDRPRLFLASLLALFLELALIRFFPAHVRVVGYFSNVILIAGFFGLGLGFLLADRAFRLERLALPLLLLAVLCARYFGGVVVLNPPGTDEPLWLFFYQLSASAIRLPMSVVVLAHFLLAVMCLAPVGQAMGRLFARLKPLEAYALDLGGSLAGVVAFGALSALSTPPLVWFSLVAALALAALLEGRRERAWGAASAAALLAAVAAMPGGGEVWSPYYRVQVLEESAGRRFVLANGALHQAILDLDSPEEYVQKSLRRFRIPYRLAPALDDVLIVGAGTGNDVAVALAEGARRVDAVEIDPAFPELGRRLHPQKPYANPAVRVHVADARTFFRRAQGRYDLVVFGTLDSQALLGGLSSIRLDNYVYTREAFEDARRLLKPGGLLAVFHMSMTDYIGERIFYLLGADGRPPRHYSFSDHTLFNKIFVAGLPGAPPLDAAQRAALRDMRLPTDDWPFLYLRNATIPRHYLEVLAGMLLLSILGTALALRGRLRRLDGPLFFLGAGFLLLETKSVTQMSILFGSTWKVNLLVFSSILAVLLAANLYIRRRVRLGRRTVQGLFVALAATLVMAAYAPVAWIAGAPALLRWLLGGTAVALPIGLAGLLFPSLFRRAADPRAAFGSNLLGAVLGGAAEYSVMAFGLSSLSLLAAALYLLAFLLWQRRARG